MCPKVQTLFWTHFLIFILPLSSEMEFDIQTSLTKFDGLFPCISADLGPHSCLHCSLPEGDHSQLCIYHLQVFPWSQLENIGIEKKKQESQKRFLGVYHVPGAGWFLGYQMTSLGATLSFRQNPDVDGRTQSELPVWMCLPKFMHLGLSQWVTVQIWSLVKSNELIRTVLMNGLMPRQEQWVSYRESGFAWSSVFFPWCLCLPELLLHCNTAQKCYAMLWPWTSKTIWLCKTCFFSL